MTTKKEIIRKTLTTLTALALGTTIACAKDGDTAAERNAAALAQVELELKTWGCRNRADIIAYELEKIVASFKANEHPTEVQRLALIAKKLRLPENTPLNECAKAFSKAKAKVKWSTEYFSVATGAQFAFQELRNVENTLTEYECEYSNLNCE